MKIVFPYIFSSNNLISKNNYNCEYVEATLYYSYNERNSTIIKNNESAKVDKLIKVIDELSIKKTTKPKERTYSCISFVTTYKGDDNIIYTQDMFEISFYKNNVIGFKRKPQYKERYYKIQNEDFDITKVIKEL